MNKQYIARELKKRGVPVEFYWYKDVGPALRFYTGKSGDQAYWNALLPIDDESDARFVEFVVSHFKRDGVKPRCRVCGTTNHHTDPNGNIVPNYPLKGAV